MKDEQIAIKVLNDNTHLLVSPQTSIYDLMNEDQKACFIVAKVNNQLTSLFYKLKVNSTIEFLPISNTDGMEVYRQTLAFLLEKTVVQLFPESQLTIMHSIGNGYYYELKDELIQSYELSQIETAMRETINACKPILRKKFNYTEAVTEFTNRKMYDKLALLETLNLPSVIHYQCDDFIELIDVPLAINTSLTPVFSLIPYSTGFVLQFPTIEELSKPDDFKEQKRIFSIYKKHKHLDRILDVNTVGALNKKIVDKKIIDIIHIEEAQQEAQIVQLAQDIISKGNIRLIAIAGPSSSGKTTFSKRLELQLKANGLTPKVISVDDYFVDRDKTPIGSDGLPDFENINAINLELFNNHLKSLLDGEKTQLAHFDFKTGTSSLSDEKHQLNDNEILIIEGIHCLNEKLTYNIPKQSKYKIYISALTHINIDNTTRVPTTDNRLIRRLVRDYNYRGHSAVKTLEMWANVRAGEQENIFPFQNDADGYFNSALLYEIAVLKPHVEPILQQVHPDNEFYSESSRLLKLLSYFLPMSSEAIPKTSILREFIGGSTLNY